MNKIMIPCRNCKGKGELSHFKHVEGGRCFKCNGTSQECVNRETYESYQQTLNRADNGYTLFNNGLIEYYKNKKEIEAKYGIFKCYDYGNCSVLASYRDDNILYFDISNDDQHNKKMLTEINKEFNLRKRKKLLNEIRTIEKSVKNTKDIEIKSIFKSAILDLKKELNFLETCVQ
ncbi:hypothetical protein [Bacillus safensis]|uniref:hypothetical protein n=1 Tax=Bacillus safensis TaxID=561879 RepID=UPI00148EC3D7|nr:hypothetical protein [Bacillus safensis]NOL36819.1 hypothetical protein [Bacillus safensis]